MTFRRFMDLALYHPTDGYYATSRIRVGRGGDYVTSPEVSPLFGYAVGRQLSEFWRCLGMPEAFTVLEFGAGTGKLARDILHWLGEREPQLLRALHYRLVERSAMQRRWLAESMAASACEATVEVVDDPDALPRECGAGCVLANELLDSFPVHRVVARGEALRELYVTVEKQALVEMEGEPSTEALSDHFGRLGLFPGDGCVAEVNLGAPAWISRAAGSLQSGYLLLFDYGHQAAELYAAWRRSGTLLCYHRHEAGDDPYRLIGHQDITSHVDFTTLTRVANHAGLPLLGLTPQSRFLLNLGIDHPRGSAPPAGTGAAEYFARRRAVEALIDPAGLGRIAALLLGKAAPHCRFTGFADLPASSPAAGA